MGSGYRPEDEEGLADAWAEQQASDADDAAAKLAHKMAKAAGPQKAQTMARACYMLLCTAALVSDPDGYFEWLDKQQAG